jgi:hypothetical protein
VRNTRNNERFSSYKSGLAPLFFMAFTAIFTTRSCLKNTSRLPMKTKGLSVKIAFVLRAFAKYAIAENTVSAKK